MQETSHQTEFVLPELNVPRKAVLEAMLIPTYQQLTQSSVRFFNQFVCEDRLISLVDLAAKQNKIELDFTKFWEDVIQSYSERYQRILYHHFLQLGELF